MLRLALCILLAACSVYSTRGESYRDWLDSAPQGKFPLVLNPWLMQGKITALGWRVEDTRQSRPDDYRYWSIPELPNGGYLGTLDLDGVPPGSTLTLLYSQVLEKDLLPSAKGEKQITWQGSMGLLDFKSPIRVVRHRVDYSLEGGTVRIPVLFPVADNRVFRGNSPYLLSLRAELRDAAGNVLVRSLPVELAGTSPGNFGGREEPVSWIFGSEEVANRRLNELAAAGSTEHCGDTWPESMAPFVSVESVWLSSGMLSGLPEKSLKRAQLMGVWLYGTSGTIATLRGEAGPPTEARVLGGAAALENRSSAQAMSKSRRSQWRNLAFNNYYGKHNKLIGKKSGLFLEPVDLFADLRPRLIGISLGVLGGYLLLSMIVLPLGFMRLKGEGRMRLWWIAPGLAALFSLAGLLVGKFLLPDEASAEVREIRFMYKDKEWPEAFVSTNTRWMSPRAGSESWKLPAGAFVIPTREFSMSINGTEPNSVWEYSPEASVYKSKEMLGGRAAQHQFGAFVSMDCPVEIVGGEVPELRAMQNFEDVLVWRAGELVSLGAVKPGEGRPLNGFSGLKWKNPKHAEEDLMELAPEWIKEVLAMRANGEELGRLRESWGNDWVVLLRGGSPLSRANPDGVATKGSVYWMIQIPAQQEEGR